MKTSLSFRLSLAAAIGSFLVLVSSASAVSDPLDPTFGVGGKATIDRGSPYDELYDIESLPDGSSLVAVSVWRYPTQQEFAVMRLQSNGSVDTSFGDGGTAVADIGGNYDYLRRIFPLADGRTLAVGYSITSGAHPSLARFEANGDLDSSFGAGGKVVDTASPLGQVRTAALVGDSGVAVVGSTGTYPYDLGVSRYEANGRLDTSFAIGGSRIFDFGFAEYAAGIVADAAGRLTIVGTQFGADAPDVLVARLTSGGAIDTSFGSGGTRSVNVPDRFIPSAVALQQDGGILLAGQLQRYPALLGAVVRLDATGALDTSFGDGGVVVVPSSGYMADIDLRGDGSIVVAGSAGTVSADFVVALLDEDGSFDPSFSDDGVHTTDFFGEEDAVTALSLGPRASVIVAGRADRLPYYWQTNFDLAFARYRLAADTTPPILTLPSIVLADATSPMGASVDYSNLVSATDETDGLVPLSCTPPSGSLFPIGDTTVECTATDGAGNSSTAPFTVHVRGADEQVADLLALVESYDLGKLGTSLHDKLVTVQRFLAAGKPRQAEENLDSFIGQVEAQRGKGLTAEQADALSSAALRIMDVIDA